MTDPSSKVVELNARRESPVAAAPLSAAALALRDNAANFLQGQLVVFLDEVDDALFELADEASNAREQHVYFDAMREVRVNREIIEKRFSEAFINTFVAIAAGNPSPSPVERGQAKLKLLESEALEELVALEGMANKAERRFLREVWVLCTAWQHVVSGPVVAAKELPMGPARIASAFGLACQSLDIDIKAKLVVFKLFDTKVLTKFGDLYSVLIPVLEAQGLPLEQLENTSHSSPSAAVTENSATGSALTANQGTAQDAAQGPSPSAALVTQLFDALEGLLQNNSSDTVTPKTALSKPSFMVALQEMQLEQFAQFNVPVPQGGERKTDFNAMAKMLVTRLNDVNWVANTDVSALSYQRDQDTINFVGTLFQFILDGDGLAESLKGLIARLQIPVLKMAMLDKGFFSYDEHPARKLLSALVSAGIGWSPVAGVERDPLYKKIEDVVMRILRDFGVDTQVFIDAYEDFSAFSEKAKRRAELVARRTVDAEDGKAAAESARMYIAAILERKLGGVDCPPVITKILQLGWSKVLFLTYIQHGKESDRFTEDVGLIERLLWSVQPSDDPGHRNELIAALPVVVETLRLGFTRVSLNSFETDRWFEQLERLHLAKLSRRDVVVTAPEDSTKVDKSAKDEPEQRQSIDGTSDVEGSELEETRNDTGAQATVIDSIENNVTSGLGKDDLAGLDAVLSKSLGDDVNLSASSVHSVPLTALTSDDSSTDGVEGSELDAKRIQALRVGSWVDFRQEDGQMLRCRLAAVINGIGKYIFVNRSGIKVAELNRDELASALADHSVVLIDDDRLFDRALESVISNLRDMKDKPL
ncbi:Uncharacterised protein [Zhongshania aliphaticivorans]|uniref:Thymidine phosphorylase n=1 Tax=Zhongshania aliphaticivorans TaxID=1470434 RepID=A0A5S9NUX6_9GAMM|nr:DUF1631 domain-containing protein [Zhongshania aliphaticivorans]CAA0094500.1 Uncharacterised protein [Zhongshania aliphaticivorans]CAA0112526.1 Uncharacterised protein [Zhongshania aliphaticivorans]